jgi:hypothetical protein
MKKNKLYQAWTRSNNYDNWVVSEIIATSKKEAFIKFKLYGRIVEKNTLYLKK